MTEGPERRAAGPRSARDSGAPADLDLSSHDWRGLIEQLPLAVYIDRLDKWSSNIYTSPQLEAILGYTTEEWAAEDHLLLRVLHPDDRERVIAAHLRSCETGEPFRMEYRMISRDGRVVWFLDQATVVRDCLRVGHQWSLQGLLASEESVSGEMFRTALKLAQHRDLLSAESPQVGKRRRENTELSAR